MLKALEISPQGMAAHYLLGFNHLMQARPDKALDEFEREPIMMIRRLGLVLAYHVKGKVAQSDGALGELIKLDSAASACQIAWACAYRGEADRAFAWLERASDQRDHGLATLKTHPLLRDLHPDPRWLPFLKKMGLS